uniref:Uncharacterized protein n=1 Tax=Caenorhabditis japonica TaxID=281687 RepID=A0A8R1IZV4_CAEJA
MNRLKAAEPTIVDGPSSPASKLFPQISITDSNISGADEPSAMSVRLLTVSFHTRTRTVNVVELVKVFIDGLVGETDHRCEFACSHSRLLLHGGEQLFVDHDRRAASAVVVFEGPVDRCEAIEPIAHGAIGEGVLAKNVADLGGRLSCRGITAPLVENDQSKSESREIASGCSYNACALYRYGEEAYRNLFTNLLEYRSKVY